MKYRDYSPNHSKHSLKLGDRYLVILYNSDIPIIATYEHLEEHEPAFYINYGTEWERDVTSDVKMYASLDDVEYIGLSENFEELESMTISIMNRIEDIMCKLDYIESQIE